MLGDRANPIIIDDEETILQSIEGENILECSPRPLSSSRQSSLEPGQVRDASPLEPGEVRDTPEPARNQEVLDGPRSQRFYLYTGTSGILPVSLPPATPANTINVDVRRLLASAVEAQQVFGSSMLREMSRVFAHATETRLELFIEELQEEIAAIRRGQIVSDDLVPFLVHELLTNTF